MTTPQDILDAIKKHEDKWGWQVCYTFGHVVLDDLNLGDSAIDVCMNDEVVQSGKLNDMEKSTYDFLVWLKSIPEPIRLKAEDLYHGNQ